MAGMPSIFTAIESWVQTNPDALAILDPERGTRSFGELWCEAARIAESLRRAGIHRDEVVAVVSSNGADLLVAELGVSLHCACAPLNPALTRSEFEACFSALRPSALLADSSAGAALDAAAALGLPTLEERASAGPAWDTRKCPGVRFIFQTSGTTAAPKLVPLTEGVCATRAFSYRDRLGLTSTDTVLCMTPPFLHQGWIASLAQLVAGGNVIQAGKFAPQRFQQWLEEYAPTWYIASPAVHRAVVALGQPISAGRLRFVRSSGAALSDQLLDAIEHKLGVPVVMGYGLTETGSIAGTSPGSRRKPGSVGISTGTEIAILNEQSGLGEIAVRGPAVVTGYCGDESGLQDGWFHTGDLGLVDDEGYLFVKGRINERINRGGEKVMPQEVEDVLNAHPAVEESSAFGIPHPTLGEDVACAVVLKSGMAATTSEIREFASLRLVPYKVPRRVLFLDEIPRNASQKPRRDELRRLVGSVGAQSRDVSSLTPVEERLAAIWKRILNREEIRAEDNFFELGGDSLQAAVMLSEVNVNSPAFFKEPTLARLAEILTTLDLPAEACNVIAIRASGTRIPLFVIPASSDDPFYPRYLAHDLGHDQPFFILNTSGKWSERTKDSVEAAAQRSIDALRAAQANGPYILGGHCYGGVVAFEAARRLVNHGEKVALVALFDVPAPGYPKVLTQLPKYIAKFRMPMLRTSLTHIQHLLYLARRKAIAKLSRQGGGAPLAKAAATMLSDPVTVGRPCSYEPKSIEVPVFQFMATGVEVSSEVLEDARLGWRDFALAGFATREVPGGHDSILLEPNASSLAAELRDVLNPWNAGK